MYLFTYHLWDLLRDAMNSSYLIQIATNHLQANASPENWVSAQCKEAKYCASTPGGSQLEYVKKVLQDIQFICITMCAYKCKCKSIDYIYTILYTYVWFFWGGFKTDMDLGPLVNWSWIGGLRNGSRLESMTIKEGEMDHKQKWSEQQHGYTWITAVFHFYPANHHSDTYW